MTEQEKHANVLARMIGYMDGQQLGVAVVAGLRLPLALKADEATREAFTVAIAALLRQSPPPALAVEDAKRDLVQHVRELISIAVCDGSRGTIGHTEAKADALIAAVQSSRAAEPGTCATCRHRQADLICHYEASPIYRMATSDTQAVKLCCIFHAPQEPSR